MGRTRLNSLLFVQCSASPCPSPYSHKQEADNIVRVAQTANETSAEAYGLLLRALEGEDQTALEIQELHRK